MGIEIRKATYADLNNIQELSEEVLPNAFHGVLTTEQIDYMLDRLYSQEALRYDIKSEDHIAYVATIDGVDCAYACLIKQGPDLYFMPKIYVDNRQMRKGIGTKLFNTMIENIKESHPTPLTIEVKVNHYNRARKFYEKLGFRVTREDMTSLNEAVIAEEVWSKTI